MSKTKGRRKPSIEKIDSDVFKLIKSILRVKGYILTSEFGFSRKILRRFERIGYLKKRWVRVNNSGTLRCVWTLPKFKFTPQFRKTFAFRNIMRMSV